MGKQYYILELRYSFGDFEQVLYPVVLLGDKDRVLIDCGYPGSVEMLEQQLRVHHIPPETITKLVLTHQDDDHIGSAWEWKEKYPKTQILASSVEAPYISGEKRNKRLQQAEEMQASLPEKQKDWGEQFCERYRRLKPVAIDRLLHPGDMYDWGGGCEILATPGHTPGHISIRSVRNDYLITGDAAVLDGGELVIANPQFCLDREKADSSLSKIRKYGSKEYICYHCG